MMRRYSSSSSEDLSSPDLSSMDQVSRKHFTKLYSLTNELVHRRDDKVHVYQSKLYRKYRTMKKLNRQLQEKILSQHCSGCHCFPHRSEQTSSARSSNQENISPEISEESSSDDEESDTNRFSKLPQRLQEIIRDYINKYKHREFLLKLDRCPKLCQYISGEPNIKIDANEVQKLISPHLCNAKRRDQSELDKKIRSIHIHLGKLRSKYRKNIVSN